MFWLILFCLQVASVCLPFICPLCAAPFCCPLHDLIHKPFMLPPFWSFHAALVPCFMQLISTTVLIKILKCCSINFLFYYPLNVGSFNPFNQLICIHSIKKKSFHHINSSLFSLLSLRSPRREVCPFWLLTEGRRRKLITGWWRRKIRLQMKRFRSFVYISESFH